MGLEYPTYDNAIDIGFVRTNLYKGPLANTIFNLFQTDISQALSLYDIETVSLFLQLQLDGVEGLGTQDLTIMQFIRDIEGNPKIIFFQSHSYHSCNIQVTNPCNFIILH